MQHVAAVIIALKIALKHHGTRDDFLCNIAAQKIVSFAKPQFLCNIVALKIVVKSRPV